MGLPLTIFAFGTQLKKRSDRIVLREGNHEVLEVPFFRVSEIVVPSKAVSLSTDLIHEACRRGIRILFLARGGRPFAVLSSPLLGASVSVRRSQIEAFRDRRGLHFATRIVKAKLQNQSRLLRYFNRAFTDKQPDRHALVEKTAALVGKAAREIDTLDGFATIDQARSVIMGIEGAAGRVYWRGVGEIIKDRIHFPGRTGRGAVDGLNALLNYGYGILASSLWGAVLNAGLDPYAGFLHVDRPGKPSLVLDLEEEFRQPLVDRVIFKALHRGLCIRMENQQLSLDTRREIAGMIAERLDQPANGGKTLLRSNLQSQVRKLASFLARISHQIKSAPQAKTC